MMVGAGTMSYFDDTEVATGNTFTAGTIDIEIDPTSGQIVTTPCGFEDLKPCQTGYITESVTNVGLNPCHLWKHITNVANDDGVEVEPEEEYYNLYPESEAYLLSDWIHYDLSVCSYNELELTELDFAKYGESEPGYEFDVTRICNGDLVTWIIELDEDSTPSLSQSEVELVISTDGITPDFLIGCNAHESCPLYKEYNGGWGSATDVLPDGMTVTGQDGERHFEISIPMSYLNGCYGDFYWAMNIGADFAGTNGASFYRYTTDWGWSSITYHTDNCGGIALIEESQGYYLTDKDTNPANSEMGIECNWIYLGILEPGQTIVIRQSYHLDADVENWGQSDVVTFDMEFFAQQTVGDPAPPAPNNEINPWTWS